MRTISSAVATALLGTALALHAAPRGAPDAAGPGTDLEGTWTINPREDGRLQLNIQSSPTSNWGRSIGRAELRGLTDAQIGSPTSVPVTFRIEREAGVLEMEGAFREGRGAGHFRFVPDAGFRTSLRSAGVRGAQGLTDRQLLHLALADASARGARELAGLLEPFDAEGLIRLSVHGVTPEYVRSLRAAGLAGTNTVGGVVELRIHRITVDYIREMEALGFRDLSRRQLLEMGIHGVSTQQVRELRAAGLTNLSPQQLVQLRIHGITPAYLERMRAGGFTGLTPEHLVELKIHRITPEYVRELAELGYRDLPRQILLQMGIHGVTPAFIREMREAGFTELPAETLVRMKIHGIDSEFVRGARRGRS